MLNSTTRSFRLDKTLSIIVDEEAKRMGISVNAMINVILKQYCDFTRFQSKLDMVVLNREILTGLLNFVEDEKAYDLGLKMGENIPVDTIIFWKKKLTISTILEYIEMILCRYGYLGTYDEINDEHLLIVVIRHRLGKKGSDFLAGYIKSLLKQIDIENSVERTNCSIKIQIKK